MSTCKKCGTKLPALSFGEFSELCRVCRSNEPPPTDHEVEEDALPESASHHHAWLNAVNSLVAVNIIAFVVTVFAGVSPIRPSGDDLLRWGADFGPLTLSGEFWRTVTSSFLHFGIPHLAVNLWCLVQLGRMAERALGSSVLIFVYVLTGIGGSILSLAWDPMRISAGASGAVFGIAGLLIAYLHFVKLGIPRSRVVSLLGYVSRFAIYNLIAGLFMNSDNMAHLGGLVTGLLLGAALARSPNRQPARNQRRPIFLTAGLVLSLLFVQLTISKAHAVEWQRGVDAFERKDYPAAIDHYEKFVAAQPDDAYGHASLGLAFHSALRIGEATREYETALRLSDDMLEAEINLARIYTNTARDDRAVFLFRKAINRVAPDASNFLLYGRALANTKRYSEAERTLRRSIELDSRDWLSHDALSEVLRAQGKTKDAVEEAHLAESLKDDPR